MNDYQKKIMDKYLLSQETIYEDTEKRTKVSICYLNQDYQTTCYINQDPQNQDFLIKLCVKEIEFNNSSKSAIKAIQREQVMTETISKIESPYILKIYDIIRFENKLMIFMDLGTSLQSILSRKCKDTNLNELFFDNQTLEFYLDIIYQITQNYLIFEKNSIIHRDIKPSNIIVRKKGSKYFYNIIDFGFSKIFDLYGSFTKGGTREYASPQMLSYPSQTSNITNKTDVFSLGIILYFLLYREFPFKDSPSQFEFFYKIKNGTFVFPEKHHNIENIKKGQELILKMIQFEEKDRFGWTDLHKYLLGMKFKRKDSIFMNVQTNEFKLFSEKDMKFNNLTKSERFPKMVKLIEQRVQFLEKQHELIKQNEPHLNQLISNYNVKLLILLIVILQKEQYQNGRALILGNLLLLSEQLQQQYDQLHLYTCLKEFNFPDDDKEKFIKKCYKQILIYKKITKETIDWIEKLQKQTIQNLGLNELCTELNKNVGEQDQEFLIAMLKDLCEPIWIKLIKDEKYKLLKRAVQSRHKYMIDSYRDVQ